MPVANIDCDRAVGGRFQTRSSHVFVCQCVDSDCLVWGSSATRLLSRHFFSRAAIHNPWSCWSARAT
eukprot:11218927-Lingulodinium_polyedra.AAC.1